MNSLLKELHEENMDSLLRTLIRKTEEGRQKWIRKAYSPISFIRSMDTDNTASIYQGFKAKTIFNGLSYLVDLTELVDCITGKGDIFGNISCEKPQEVAPYDFGLSCQFERYVNVDADQVQSVFHGDAAIGIAELMIKIFQGSQEVEKGFSFGTYFDRLDIDKGWNLNALAELGQKLMKERRIKDFHRIIFDVSYRKKLLLEIKDKS